MNPIEKFKQWYNEETKKSSSRIPSACCLTSNGFDGFPNSRFVSLKEIIHEQFVITGPLKSRKGIELIENPKCSLTFWWAKTEKQVRIQGIAKQIEFELAEKYFRSRNKDSQLVSLISKQGNKISDLGQLIDNFEKKKEEIGSKEIKRPENWSGFYITPKRIELMEFKKSRFHLRELYEKEGSEWRKTILQP